MRDSAGAVGEKRVNRRHSDGSCTAFAFPLQRTNCYDPAQLLMSIGTMCQLKDSPVEVIVERRKRIALQFKGRRRGIRAQVPCSIRPRLLILGTKTAKDPRQSLRRHARARGKVAAARRMRYASPRHIAMRWAQSGRKWYEDRGVIGGGGGHSAAARECESARARGARRRSLVALGPSRFGT